MYSENNESLVFLDGVANFFGSRLFCTLVLPITLEKICHTVFSVNLPIGFRLFDTVLPIVDLSEIDHAKCLLDLKEDEEIEDDDDSSIVSS